MLKFIKGHLESMSDVEIYPIISLLIFFSFFTIVTYRAIRARKEYIDEVSQLPLDNNDE